MGPNKDNKQPGKADSTLQKKADAPHEFRGIVLPRREPGETVAEGEMLTPRQRRALVTQVVEISKKRRAEIGDVEE